jgi:hypothetical protein
MSTKSIGRLIGTTVLIAVSVAIYMAGMWTAWAFLFGRLPTPFGILVMLGAAIAPIQMVRDVIEADRTDRHARIETSVEKE